MGDAKSFKLQLAAFSDEIEELTINLMKEIAKKGLQSIVARSPVDTGLFRGNWIVTLGAPSLSTSKNLDKKGDKIIAEGSKIIEGLSGLRTIWIQNNLHYGPILEGGWSKQAPAGMVAITVAELETEYG